ncbi:MAG: P-loop NTPase, partial [Actinobacteria bacterium]|nr:P-loop NTPase [Actinomycetota bacterium]
MFGGTSRFPHTPSPTHRLRGRPVSGSSPARRVVAIASGKGGVGKSTLTLNLALALSARGSTVGVLDADLYGPDIPLMVGLKRTERARELQLWRLGRPISLPPVEVHGL